MDEKSHLMKNTMNVHHYSFLSFLVIVAIKCMYQQIFLLYCDVHPSEMDYQKIMKFRVGTWFPSTGC